MQTPTLSTSGEGSRERRPSQFVAEIDFAEQSSSAEGALHTLNERVSRATETAEEVGSFVGERGGSRPRRAGRGHVAASHSATDGAARVETRCGSRLAARRCGMGRSTPRIRKPRCSVSAAWNVRFAIWAARIRRPRRTRAKGRLTPTALSEYLSGPRANWIGRSPICDSTFERSFRSTMSRRRTRTLCRRRINRRSCLRAHPAKRSGCGRTLGTSHHRLRRTTEHHDEMSGTAWPAPRTPFEVVTKSLEPAAFRVSVNATYFLEDPTPTAPENR